MRPPTLPPPPPFQQPRPGLVAQLWQFRGLVVVGIVGLVALVGWATSARRGADGGISSAGDLAAAELRVGDCVDTPEGFEFVELTAKPCAEPHDLELFHQFEVPGSAYPSEGRVLELVGQHCLTAFELYVGARYEESALDVNWFSPSPDGWRQGDRTVQCLAVTMDGSKLTGSVRGSGR